MADETFEMIGDHRDIPMSLGLLLIAWNACETQLRELLNSLASGGNWPHARLVDILIVELGSTGIAQALNCYANEFPSENADIAASIIHATKFLERTRAYRNYYVHGIDAVTAFGFTMNDQMLDDDVPVHEAMEYGPFGKIFSRTAKSKVKFGMNFLRASDLSKTTNQLADFNDYLRALNMTVNHYLRALNYAETAPLPQPLPLPDVLEKPSISHPKLGHSPALSLQRLKWRSSDEQEEENIEL